jgi:hypothetical protein
MRVSLPAKLASQCSKTDRLFGYGLLRHFKQTVVKQIVERRFRRKLATGPQRSAPATSSAVPMPMPRGINITNATVTTGVVNTGTISRGGINLTNKNWGQSGISPPI